MGNISVAAVLLAERKARGLTLQRIHERSGRAISTISGIESGNIRRPEPDLIKDVAHGMAANADDEAKLYTKLSMAVYGLEFKEEPPLLEGDSVTQPDGPHPSETEESWTQPARKRLSVAT